MMMMGALAMFGCGGDDSKTGPAAGQVTPTAACSADIACSSGSGKYHSCVKNATNASTCSSYYVDSNGKEYPCAGCGNCTEAAKLVVAWCGTTTKSEELSALGLADDAMNAALTAETR